MVSFFKWYVKSKSVLELFLVVAVSLVILCVILALTFGIEVGAAALLCFVVISIIGSVFWMIVAYVLDTVRTYKEHKQEEEKEIIRRLKGRQV